MQSNNVERLGKLASVFLLAAITACTYTPIQTQPSGNGQQQSEAEPWPSELPQAEQESEADESVPQRVAIATPDSVSRPRDTTASAGAQTATNKLRAQAELASDQGAYDKAERLLDRALRIAPREAATYYQLALVKLRQGTPGRALQLARKGLSLGPSDSLSERLRDIEAEAEAKAGG